MVGEFAAFNHKGHEGALENRAFVKPRVLGGSWVFLAYRETDHFPHLTQIERLHEERYPLRAS
jgi:hypothetical protein